MTDHNPPGMSINRWFLIPFLIWMVVGSVLLMVYSRRDLFAAFNGIHTSTMDVVMRQLTNLGDGTAITFILLLLLGAPRLRNWWYVITAVLCNALPAIVIQGVKAIFNSPRPFEYYKNDSSWIHFSEKWGDVLYHHSFPSGHSGGAFSIFCFLALLLPARYQWLGLPLFLLALIVGFTRMYLAAHFFLDVYVGSILGTLITVLGFQLMKKIANRFYGSNGPKMAIRDN